MPVDTSIYGNLLRPPKSIAEYGAEMDAAEQNKLALQGQRMNLLSAQRAEADQQALRQLYAAPDFNPSTDDGIMKLMRVNPQAGFAAQKARLDARKGEAELAETGAKTKKEEALTQKASIEAAGKRLETYRSALDFVDTPEGAARWLKAQFEDPLTAGQMSALGSYEQAVTRIPQDPQGFQQWRRMAAMGMEKHMEQLRKDRNELIGPDGKPNQAVVQAKKDIAAAGKTAVNVGVNTEKSLLGNVAETLGKDITEQSQAARGAQNTLQAVAQVRQALKGKAITGPAANPRLVLGQIGYQLGLGGAEAEETLQATRSAIQGMAQLELTGAEQMRGQGQITEAERALIRRAASGDINMTTPELNTLMNGLEKTSKAKIARNQRNVDILRKNPNAAPVVEFLDSNGSPAQVPGFPSREAIEAERKRRGL